MKRYRQVLEGVRVLVVEDDRINREILEEILSTAGVVTRGAVDGAEAVNLVFSEPFDAVLMDVHMPNMDGHEAARRIREDKRFQTLPIIAMTGGAVPGEVEKCINAGMNQVVAKPIRQEGLFQALVEQVNAKEPALSKVSAVRPQAAGVENRAPTAAAVLREKGLNGLNITQALGDLEIGFAAYLRVLERFLKQNTHTIDQIKALAAEKDRVQIQSLAHRLRGSSASIGAPDLAAVLGEIETFCREKEGAALGAMQLDPLLDRLEKNWYQVAIAIKHLVDFQADDTSHAVSASGDPVFLLSKLRNALIEADPEEISSCLIQVKGSIPETMTVPIENKINAYEYDEAIAAVLRVSEKMGITLEPAERK